MASITLPENKINLRGIFSFPIPAINQSTARRQKEPLDEFETRISDIINLIEDGLLTHEHLCRILKRLIGVSNYSQIRTLWTSLQPLLHRDFMFKGQLEEPETPYIPLSTALSRDIRTHLTRTRNVSRYHRVQSAHLTNEEEVFQHNKLPPIATGRGNNLIDSVSGKIKIHFPPNPKKSKSEYSKVSRKSRISEEKVGQRLKVRGEQKSLEIKEKVENLFVSYDKWTNPERAQFFKKVLPKLESRQLYFLSTYLSVRQHRDFIAKLPRKIALKILSHLTAKELANASRVCKKWHKICLEGALWEEKCEEVRSEIATPAVNARDQTYYDVYRSNHIRQRNWSRARCSHAHLEGHVGKVLSVAFNSKILISGGADATVRVWSTRNAAALQIMTGHSKGVWSLALFTDVLVVSGSYDHTVKIWNVQQGTCLRTLFGHTGAVWTLACKQHLVATGSHDKLIKVWDLSHCRLQRTLKGHSSAIFAVDISDDLTRIFSGSADHSVRIWNSGSGKCLKVIWASTSSPVMSVSFENGYLAYSEENILNLYDVANSKLVKTYRGHKCRIETVKIRVKIKDSQKKVSILSAGRDGRVKHWRLGVKGPVKTMVAHKDCQVNCIAFDKKRLVTALYDDKICMCDFSVTEEITEM